MKKTPRREREEASQEGESKEDTQEKEREEASQEEESVEDT